MDTYAIDVYEGFNVTEAEVNQFREHHVGFCHVDMSRVSQFLIIQLASISKHRIYNSFSITDVIQELEGLGRGCEQRVEQFGHLPLKGLWKAHFHDASFIPRNLINYWGLEFENSSKSHALCSRVVNDEEKSPSKFAYQGRLAHELTIGAYQAKTRKKGLAGLTGEWIIFAKHNGLNYYLCISRHTSKKEDQDAFNFLKLLCEHEYPFLLSEEIV